MPRRKVRPPKAINQEVMKAIQVLTDRSVNKIVTLSEIVQHVKSQIDSEEYGPDVTKVIREAIYQLRNMGLIGYIGYNKYCCAECFAKEEEEIVSSPPEETGSEGLQEENVSADSSNSVDSGSVSGNEIDSTVRVKVTSIDLVEVEEPEPVTTIPHQVGTLKRLLDFEKNEKVTSEEEVDETRLPRWLKTCIVRVRKTTDCREPEYVSSKKSLPHNNTAGDQVAVPSGSKMSLLKMLSRSVTSMTKTSEETPQNSKVKNQRKPPPPSQPPTPIGKPDPAHFVPEPKGKSIPEKTSSLDPNRKRRNSADVSSKSLSGDEVERTRKQFYGKKKIEKVNPDVRLPGARQHSVAKRPRIEDVGPNYSGNEIETEKVSQSHNWFQSLFNKKSKSTDDVNISPVSSDEMKNINPTCTPLPSVESLWQEPRATEPENLNIAEGDTETLNCKEEPNKIIEAETICIGNTAGLSDAVDLSEVNNS